MHTDLESAAHGYVECLDTFNPTKGFKCTLDKIRNQRANEGMFVFEYILITTHNTSSDGHRAKKAKSIMAKLPGPSNNQELQ